MNTPTQTDDKWFYVVIQDPGTSSEELMGFQTDSTPPLNFIPAFESKEEAQQCFLIMPKSVMERKYEIQAIIKDDLLGQAATSGYSVFLMDDKSTIKKELK